MCVRAGGCAGGRPVCVGGGGGGGGTRLCKEERKQAVKT